jgi:hypothetical protein
MSINAKDESSVPLPACPACGATMDLKRQKSFSGMHISSDDGKLYYCNNPLCPPTEVEQKLRSLSLDSPFVE